MNIVDSIARILKQQTKKMPRTLIDQIIIEYGKDPFLILMACLLSLRAKDIVTIHVCRELFSRAKTPNDILCIPDRDLEKIFFRLGFYKTKAKVLKHVAKIIKEEYKESVPSSYQALINIKGIGSKTANLVVSMAFNKPAICVDTHVHRISNRLGLIKTRTAQETEHALEKIVPIKYWRMWNTWLVMWGQHVCKPLNPQCFKCVLRCFCKLGLNK
jgi:endonuclease-3